MVGMVKLSTPLLVLEIDTPTFCRKKNMRSGHRVNWN